MSLAGILIVADHLPSPGTDETGGLVKGPDLDRLLYGNVLEAYSTEMFGSNITRSDTAKKRLERLAYLNQKELQQGLSESELKEQAELRTETPTSAHLLPRDFRES